MNKKILIVYADYYKDISDNLLDNALKHLHNPPRRYFGVGTAKHMSEFVCPSFILMPMDSAINRFP